MTLAEQAPVLETDDATRLARELWGLASVRTKDLGSHQDRNFLITTQDGQRHVLKVANTAVPDEALDAQDAAMLALVGLPLRLPVPMPSDNGALRRVAHLQGSAHAVRMLTWVAGEPMTEVGHFAPTTARAFGALAGRVNAALSGFDHPGAHRAIQWDVRRTPEVLASTMPSLDGALADRLRVHADRALAALEPVAEALPQQVIHGDLTDFNVVSDPGPDGRAVPAGVIDFGDLVWTWRASDIAITLCALLSKDLRDPLRIAADVLAGFLAEQPLEPVEIDAIWPMVAARACVGLASTLHQLTTEPDNPYLHENLAVDTIVFETVAAIPLHLGLLAMRRAAGLPLPPAPALPVAQPMISGLAESPVLDLSTTGPLLDEGTWLEPEALRRAIAAGGSPAVIPYAQPHLHRAPPLSLVEPQTIHLGVTVLLPLGAPVQAPWAGTLEAGQQSVRLVGAHGWDVVLTGAEPLVHGPVAAGATIAAVAPSTDPVLPDHLGVQLARSGLTAPSHAAASSAALWQHLCPDPSALLGLAPGDADAPDAGDLVRRRASSMAAVQKLYWEQPPRFERGWREYLVDITGRSYLDGVNNVAVLGHSHPAVAGAVARQLRTLNTNSRFSVGAPVEFAELLLSTMPPELDRVFLLASGSEAVDLALRLARVFTQSKDTIALRTAYHGWTTASDEVSSALMDNPRALGTRPAWIHLAEPPNLYRGAFTGPDAGARYADDVRRILTELAAADRRPAAFICETLNGNAGGIELPPDYLPAVYEAVRAAGGVVIADEVQVGYGRLGSHFWGFEMHGAVPDIVCLAKATGNGVPVSAVVCRREIADAFAVEGSLFASMGGTPVGAVAALATLRAIRDEDLMGNAARMGARLRAGLESLVERFPMAGAVHGRGLYLGLELVQDKATRTPATEATDALCERLLRLGVVMAATGDHMNVLKIKPPLCIDEAGVDFLLEALEVAFGEGW